MLGFCHKLGPEGVVGKVSRVWRITLITLILRKLMQEHCGELEASLAGTVSSGPVCSRDGILSQTKKRTKPQVK